MTLELDVMSPWAGQGCVLALEGWQSEDLCAGLPVRTWRHAVVRVPATNFRASNALLVRLTEVHPLPFGRSDARVERVGMAVRNLAFGNGQ